jgi:hypothetical protein
MNEPFGKISIRDAIRSALVSIQTSILGGIVTTIQTDGDIRKAFFVSAAVAALTFIASVITDLLTNSKGEFFTKENLPVQKPTQKG